MFKRSQRVFQGRNFTLKTSYYIAPKCIVILWLFVLSSLCPSSLAQNKKVEGPVIDPSVNKEVLRDFSTTTVNNQVSVAASDVATYEKVQKELGDIALQPMLAKLQSNGYIIDSAQTAVVATTATNQF